MREELFRLILEIEEIRARAGIEGYRVATVYSDSRVTLHGTVGDLFAQTLVLLLGIALVAEAAPGPPFFRQPVRL